MVGSRSLGNAPEKSVTDFGYIMGGQHAQLASSCRSVDARGDVRRRACLSAVAAAQAPAQGPVPLQKAGATVKISEHVYVIPDFKVGMVPNVGIVVGSRATLVIDPGMGLKNGQVVLHEVQQVSRGPDLYIVNTHFHPEHTTGEVAFPPSAQVIRAAAQQQDVDEMGMQFVERFRQRSPEIADLLKEATFRPPAEIFETESARSGRRPRPSPPTGTGPHARRYGGVCRGRSRAVFR